MKIAVLIKSTTFHTGFGGLETQNKVLCEELTKRGHRITVYSPKKELYFHEKIENNIKYMFIDSEYKKYFFAKINKNSWFNKSLEIFSKDHQKEPFDLVISQSASGESIIKHKDELGVKVVSISHGTTISEYKTTVANISGLKDLYWLIRNTQYVLRQFFGRQRKYVLGSDMVISVSHAIKKALINETFVPDERVVVIHNGINPENFTYSKNKETNKRLKLVYVGRIEKPKGVYVLLDIVNLLKEEEIYLSFVGGGEDLENLRKKVKGYGTGSKVKVLGKVPYEEVVKILVDSDVFVFPSLRYEGFPMVLPEAMICKLPVIANNIGGISDAIEDGKTGFLTKVGDVGYFKEKILELYREPELREKMGLLAYEKAIKEFTIETMVNKYESVFTEVLRK